MCVWVVIPSALPLDKTSVFQRWHDLGYSVMVLTEDGSCDPPPCIDRLIIGLEWKGWYSAINEMCLLLEDVPILIAGSDDIHPDPRSVSQLIDLFMNRFPDLDGVMQPNGDDYGYTNEICGSPWIGRSIRKRLYGGDGPFFSGYYHYFGDKELFDVLGFHNRIWMNDGAVQYHDHWTRRQSPRRPSYLVEAGKRWESDRILYESRKLKAPCEAL